MNPCPLTGPCPDCGALTGEMHVEGCDVERCPRCGGQAISCDCVYEVCGIDVSTLDDDHTEVYLAGPTAEMFAQWDNDWRHRRIPWSGEWPGTAECREYGWYAKMTSTGWTPCNPDDDGATEDLNRLAAQGRWDQHVQKWKQRG